MTGLRRADRKVGSGICVALAAFVLFAASCSSPAGRALQTPTTTPVGHASTTTTSKPVVTSAWSAPRSLPGAKGLGAVECPTVSSCVALTDSGLAYHYADGSWKPPVQTGAAAGASGGPSLSCAGPAFCMALWRGTGVAVSWNGATWSHPASVAGAQSLEGLGCASPTFCVAVDGIGVGFYFDGSGWSEGSQDWGSVTSIACANASFCVSVEGGISVWNGSDWTEPQQYGTSSVIVGVSCPYASFCAAVDSIGQAIIFNGSAWSHPSELVQNAPPIGGPTFTGVSCSGSDFCVAVDNAGNAYVWSGRSWSGAETAQAGETLTAVSCVRPVFCVATGGSGSALIRT
jgi:hypothetical protein